MSTIDDEKATAKLAVQQLRISLATHGPTADKRTTAKTAAVQVSVNLPHRDSTSRQLLGGVGEAPLGYTSYLKLHTAASVEILATGNVPASR